MIHVIPKLSFMEQSTQCFFHFNSDPLHHYNQLASAALIIISGIGGICTYITIKGYFVSNKNLVCVSFKKI